MKFIDITTFGAVGDSSTDNTGYIRVALKAFADDGGTLFFPPGTYKTTECVLINQSNVVISGDASILFSPIAPLNPGSNDRPFLIQGAFTPPSSIAGPVNRGESHFTLANPADAAAIQSGDWLMLKEMDTVFGEIYYYDQYQVSSINGTIVNLYQRIRMNFPATHNTVQFWHVTKPVQNVTIRNLKIVSNYIGPGIVGLTIGGASRGILIDNVTVNLKQGKAISTYLAADYRIINSTFNSGGSVASELSACVDGVIENNVFGFTGVAGAAPVSLDFGMAFCSFSHNKLVNAGNIGLGLFYGVHDCSIVGNTVGWVHDAGIGVGQGISGVGAYNNTVSHNILIGGDAGVGNTGIIFENDTVANPGVITQGNVIFNNAINGFVNPVTAAPRPAGDIYLDHVPGGYSV